MRDVDFEVRCSDLCKAMDMEVEEFPSRPINSSYPFVVIDATYFRVRESNRIVSKALMVACGTNEHGTREILGFQAFPNESTETWTAFLNDLKKRGLSRMSRWSRQTPMRG